MDQVVMVQSTFAIMNITGDLSGGACRSSLTALMIMVTDCHAITASSQKCIFEDSAKGLAFQKKESSGDVKAEKNHP